MAISDVQRCAGGVVTFLALHPECAEAERGQGGILVLNDFHGSPEIGVVPQGDN
jgi:hypothetical protein